MVFSSFTEFGFGVLFAAIPCLLLWDMSVKLIKIYEMTKGDKVDTREMNEVFLKEEIEAIRKGEKVCPDTAQFEILFSQRNNAKLFYRMHEGKLQFFVMSETAPVSSLGWRSSIYDDINELLSTVKGASIVWEYTPDTPPVAQPLPPMPKLIMGTGILVDFNPNVDLISDIQAVIALKNKVKVFYKPKVLNANEWLELSENTSIASILDGTLEFKLEQKEVVTYIDQQWSDLFDQNNELKVKP